jgi:hypothetical protein
VRDLGCIEIEAGVRLNPAGGRLGQIPRPFSGVRSRSPAAAEEKAAAAAGLGLELERARLLLLRGFALFASGDGASALYFLLFLGGGLLLSKSKLASLIFQQNGHIFKIRY